MKFPNWLSFLFTIFIFSTYESHVISKLTAIIDNIDASALYHTIRDFSAPFRAPLRYTNPLDHVEFVDSGRHLERNIA
jgi:hypothetical protein